MIVDKRQLEKDSNPVIPDRIELSVSIPFITHKIKCGDKVYEPNIDGKDKESYIQTIFDVYIWKFKKEYNVKQYPNKNQYYIEVPDDDFQKEFPYVRHARIRLNNPYTVTFEFNFIRYLRQFIKENEMDSSYDMAIRIDEDNYVNKQLWDCWDSYLVKNLAIDVPAVAKRFSSFIMKQYCPDFDFQYETVTVKQIEFNKDYFVGHHKSASVFHQLKYFLISASGVEWIHGLSGYALNLYHNKKSPNEETRFYGNLHIPTIKFPVAKGLYCKTYCKTSDHIRFEITMDYQYFKNRYEFKIDGKTRNTHRYEYIFEKLRNEAKEWIRKAEFSQVLVDCVNNSYADHLSYYSDTFAFLDKHKPELSAIIEATNNKSVITDNKLIHRIRCDKELRKHFKKVVLSNGQKGLIYHYVPTDVKETDVLKTYDKDIVAIINEFKKQYPEDRIFLSNDGKTVIHKGTHHKKQVDKWKPPMPYSFLQNKVK